MFKPVHTFFHRHYHRHYHGVYKNPKKLFIFDLFLLFIAIAMLGSSLFFFFWKPGTTDLIDLRISLGDTRIKSGEAIRLSVAYTNRTKFELVNTKLAIHVPDGFVVDRSKTPEALFSRDSIIALDAIQPGGKGQVEVYGTLWSEPKTDKRIVATLSYQPGKDRSVEQKLASYFLTLPESVLADSLTITASTFPGQSLPYSYILKNTAEAPIEGITLAGSWSEPLFVKNAYKNLRLEPGQSITVTGTLFAPNKKGDYPLVITSHIVANNVPVVQTRQNRTISVINPNLYSEIKVQKEFKYIEPGQEIPVNVAWKNLSEGTLENLKLRITPTDGIIDLATTARENQLKVEGSSLIIDSARRTALTRAAPRDGDAIDIVLFTLPTGKIRSTAAKLTITPSLEASSELVSGQRFSQDGTPVSFALPTNLTLQTQVRYFTAEGDQLGRGPLPPEVGSPTKYWIFAELFNTINPVEGARLSIALAPNVRATGKQSVTLGSPLKVNGANLTWDFPELAVNTKTGWYFEVEVTPNQTNVGKNLNLVQSISFAGTDEVVEKQFDLKSPAITNVLRSDDRGSRSGSKVVQP